MKMENRVSVSRILNYSETTIRDSLPDDVFELIKPGDKVVLKPNWVMESHKTKKNEWDYVITHPAIITTVLGKVIDHLDGAGEITIMDGPQTDASFADIMSRYPVEEWRRTAEKKGIPFSIVDLRDHEWNTDKGVVVVRKNLPGDPRGKVLFSLREEASEFWGHAKSRRGYYGADYNLEETNKAHDGFVNLYSVSRTVIESDVFINLPKLKTHRKAGITCCLKNLVGINTYKNYLPHYSEGGPREGGDQFPTDNVNALIEGPLMGILKQHVLKNQLLARLLSPFFKLGKKVFGNTRQVVRSGNWYGNDTIWRMILDLNKVVFYGNPDGSMREEGLYSCKKYIGVVDAVLAGEGFGPLEPEPINMGYLFCGTNPAAIDAVCATFMGLDYSRIPSIAYAFQVNRYNFCPFKPEDIKILVNSAVHTLENIPEDLLFSFEASRGWKGHIEQRHHHGKE